MATIYADAEDGYVIRTNQSSWSDARSNSVGTGYSDNLVSSSTTVGAFRGAARGGGYVWNVYRSFFFFDTSGISSDVTSAIFKLQGKTNGSGDLIAVKSTAGIETLGTSDFISIVGWTPTGDNESNVTKYSDEITSWSTSAYNDITLNAQALADIRDDDTLYICLLNFDYDLKDVDPVANTDNKNGFYFANQYGTQHDPYIDYELAVVADNATFFGANF